MIITFYVFMFPLLMKIEMYYMYIGFNIKHTCCIVYMTQMSFPVILSKRQRFHYIKYAYFSHI